MNATMNDERALATLQALASGADPVTGTTFPAGSPYQHPDTVRALYHAIRALETGTTRPKRPARDLPDNSGKPWSPGEDAQLVSAFDAGQPMETLAATHGRTRFAPASPSRHASRSSEKSRCRPACAGTAHPILA